MKKLVWTFGLLASLLITAMMLYSVYSIYQGGDPGGNEVVGYSTMILSFAFIFVAVKKYRDGHNGGVITFAKAFRIGLFITLIASTVYVLVWLVDYYIFVPDFIDRYTVCVLRDARQDGATEAEVARKSAEMASFKEMYKNPLFVILLTYAEVLPIGLLVSLLAALLLKRKHRPETS